MFRAFSKKRQLTVKLLFAVYTVGWKVLFTVYSRLEGVVYSVQ